MGHVSSSSDSLFILDALSDFCEHSDKLVTQGRREIRIFSHLLDPLLYERAEFVHCLSEFSRQSPQAHVYILIKDARVLVERGHQLIRLAQRLPSKFSIRKQGIQSENESMGFMIVDRDKLLYKNDDEVFQGFANYSAAPEIKQLMDTWELLWRNSKEDPQLRALSL